MNLRAGFLINWRGILPGLEARRYASRYWCGGASEQKAAGRFHKQDVWVKSAEEPYETGARETGRTEPLEQKEEMQTAEKMTMSSWWILFWTIQKGPAGS